MMRRFVLAALAAAASASAAQAADILPQLKPSLDWSGAYVGADLGYAWGDGTLKSPAIDYDPFNADGAASTYDTRFGGFDGSTSISGPLWGAFAGANVQVSGFVFGFDGDYAWAGLSGDRVSADYRTPDVLNGGAGPDSAGRYANADVNLTWLAHVRGRAGFAFDRVMVYVAGGLALAGLDTDSATTDPVGFAVSAKNANGTITGWTIGGGLDWAVTDSLIFRAEYLYDQFNSVELGNYTVTDQTSSGPLEAGSASISGDLSVNILRVGLSWKFDSLL